MWNLFETYSPFVIIGVALVAMSVLAYLEITD